MITLDRIKIIAPLGCVAIIRQEAFEVKTKNNAIISMSYTQTSPCKLYVEVDYKEQETVIEFTGKRLMDAYPELINSNNIRKCFNNINSLGFCHINTDLVLEHGRICSIDVTKDIEHPDAAGLSEWVRTNINNHRKYLVRDIKGNLVIEKNVKTRGCKRRLTIYDKGKELRLAENRDFLDLLSDADALLDYFKNKVRFEMNLNSKQAIRSTLNIEDTSISEILNSDKNPIYDFVNEVTGESVYLCCSLKERKDLAFLNDCGMDIKTVEYEIRKYASKGTHISQAIKPYKALLSKIQNKGQNFKGALLGLLLEIIMLPLLLVW